MICVFIGRSYNQTLSTDHSVWLLLRMCHEQKKYVTIVFVLIYLSY